MRGSDLLSSPAGSGKCRASDIRKYTPVEFSIIKSRAMALSRSPQCRAFSRVVINEKSLSPLFPEGGGGVWRGGGGGGGGGGALVTNDWCIKGCM